LVVFLPLNILYKIIFNYKRLSDKKLKSPIPIIVVGNLTLGGTGKTPMVISIAKILAKKNIKVGIISRGYGGEASKKDTTTLVTNDHTAKEIGDEVFMLYKKLHIPIAVDRNRNRAISLLHKNKLCELIISDDGLQHNKLQKDFVIVLVDGERFFGNKCLFPMGPMRSSISELNTADAIVINGNSCRKNSEIIEIKQDCVFNMQLEFIKIVDIVSKKEYEVKQWFESKKEKKINAVAGIGNPKRFFSQIKKFHKQIVEIPFADHHKFCKEDFDFDDDNPVVMTEKDYVKCDFLTKENKYFYIPVSSVLEKKFIEKIYGIAKKFGKNKTAINT
jgi:tetraacyldisaccharide 4'-kinase